jgi:hypothetical protein
MTMGLASSDPALRTAYTGLQVFSLAIWGGTQDPNPRKELERKQGVKEGKHGPAW